MDKYYIDMSDSNAYDIIKFKNKNSDNTVDDTCNINENIEGFTNMGQGYLNKCCPTGSVLNNNNECTKICNHCPDSAYNHYTYDVIEDADDSVIMYTDCKKDASPYYNFNRLNNLKNQYNLLNQYDLSQNPTNASLIKDSLGTWTDAFMNLINPEENQLDMSDFNNVIDDFDDNIDSVSDIDASTDTFSPSTASIINNFQGAAKSLESVQPQNQLLLNNILTASDSSQSSTQNQSSSQSGTNNTIKKLLTLLVLEDIKKNPDLQNSQYFRQIFQNS